MKNLLILSSLVLYAFSGISQPVPTTEFPFKMTVEQYVEKYASVAISEMHRSHIPASITLAQGLLESGNGNSRLAIQANNHFGIKCKKDWTGETLNEDDDAPQECFRKYNTPLESYKDHSDFLMGGARYAFLFDLEMTDYINWAKGLRSAGYATNPRYAEILITTIEKFGLQKYDLEKPTEAEVKTIVEEKKVEVAEEKKLIINQIPAVVVKAGESYAEIAIANDLKVWQLYKYNDLGKTAEIKAGDTLYLKPKNYKGLVDFAVVGVNDDLHLISQRYAIKESRIRKLNGLKEEDEPVTGETLFLKEKRTDAVRLKTKEVQLAAKDSTYNDQIYEDPKKNVATTQPVIPNDQYDVELHGVKEEMAFIHIVQPKETLFAISKKYNVQVDGIKMLNNLKSEVLNVGDKLIINPNQPPVKQDEEAVIPGYHVVQSGETLYSIARLYNTTVNELKSLNELQSDTIRISDELIVVPLNGEQPKEDKVSDTPEEAVYHIVKEKETMYSISRKYNVDQAEIRKLNDMIENTIHVGQKLRIR